MVAWIAAFARMDAENFSCLIHHPPPPCSCEPQFPVILLSALEICPNLFYVFYQKWLRDSFKSGLLQSLERQELNSSAPIIYFFWGGGFSFIYFFLRKVSFFQKK
ncbi:hypothetical protein GQ43DRAFT_108113 [Delitschia confertaspora ATCC 74209]|uniref:Uncharacterized protein n=1 Tax=Delitschia confertaspora ATCC 74209 TaxID=1513339 RepID=A0A9P4MNM1_9PLEO|nr:hypothetical protein GQ43DRAFT_108113 [Delitschia confertaspora ATCC 74209]